MKASNITERDERKHDPLTTAYLAIGAYEALGFIRRGAKAHAADMLDEFDGEMGAIETVISNADTLDRMIDEAYPEGCPFVFAYDVAQPVGRIYMNALFCRSGESFAKIAADVIRDAAA